MVRIAYLFILGYYTLGNVPVAVTSFSLFCRMKEDFMELYLVREQFQSDMCLVRKSKSVRIERVQPLCCTVIFVIYGVKI